MPKISAAFIIPAIIGAALAGYFLADHGSATASAAPPAADPAIAAAPPPNAAEPALPPGHPKVPGAGQAAQRAKGGLPNAENQQPATIDWKVPEGWQPAQNPNPMRLATYKTAQGAEVSVARAGGPVDANILRWSQQFAGAPQPEKTEKDVHGFHTTIVRITGTYSGGMGLEQPEKHEGWAMLAAIVEAPGAPYFFKVTGPVAQVDASRPQFDALLDSVAPRSAR